MKFLQIYKRLQSLSFSKLIEYMKIKNIDQLLYVRSQDIYRCEDLNLTISQDSMKISNFTLSDPSGFDVINRRLTSFRTVYTVLCDEKIVHESWVYTEPILPSKFGFSADIPLIGDCVTIAEFRGKGLYPYALCYIAEALLKKNIAKEVYVLVSPDNVSSIRGIEKAGYRLIGHLKAKRIFGLYINKTKIT